MFSIFFSSQSEKFLKKCDKGIYDRLLQKIQEISQNPFLPDVKRVVGKKYKAFRVRVGAYRIQYVVYHEKNEVLVFDIDKRSRAYD